MKPAARAARTTDIERGEFDARSTLTLHEYAREWVERYHGRGRRGFRESTRENYRMLLDRYVLRHFPARMKLADITPSAIAVYEGWLCDERKQGKALSDSTVRNAVTPLRACLATAVREGLIRSNPAREVDLPHRPTAEDMEDDEVKAMSREELSLLLDVFPDRWRLFFWFLAATGLRISEAIALQWRHIALDEPQPHVRVRRALVRGRFGPPKSRYGRREVPIDSDLVDALRTTRGVSARRGETDLVFPAVNDEPLMPGNLRRRVLKPAAEKADLAWIGFHAFRHTCVYAVRRRP